MGRRRPVLVAVRVTPTESADWRAKAAAAGVPLSALLRRAMARTRTWTAPAAEVERERTRQVGRIGSNLNQLARWASTHAAAERGRPSGSKGRSPSPAPLWVQRVGWLRTLKGS